MVGIDFFHLFCVRIEMNTEYGSITLSPKQHTLHFIVYLQSICVLAKQDWQILCKPVAEMLRIRCLGKTTEAWEDSR